LDLLIVDKYIEIMGYAKSETLV